MTINEKTTYTATSLPGAPPRETREEAEADEARGIELAAYLAILPTLTEEQWERVATWDMARGKAWNAAQRATRAAAWDVERNAAWVAARDEAWERGRATWPAAWAAWERGRATWPAAWAACAIVVRDLITPDQFDTLTAPMRAAGINFDGLTNHNEQEQ